MSDLKISSNLFLGKAELDRLKRFIFDDGFKKLFDLQSIGFGIVKNNKFDSSFANFKVAAGTTSGSIKIAQDSYAVDGDLNIIFQEAFDNLNIPTASDFYWVKISHTEDPEEIGTVSIDANGNLTGTGTLFTEVLRGQPNFPSKIKFIGAVNNTLEYQVVEVIDDENAILSGSFQVESDLTYKVVGTFTPGHVPGAAGKDIFQYDACSLEFVLETVVDTEPAGKVQDSEFWIARVTKDGGGNVTVFDKRTEFWQPVNSGLVVGGNATRNVSNNNYLDLDPQSNVFDITEGDEDFGPDSIDYIQAIGIGRILILNNTSGKYNNFNHETGTVPDGYCDISTSDTTQHRMDIKEAVLILIQESSSRYRIIGTSQHMSEWVDVPYDASLYGAFGGGTWSPDAAQTHLKYKIIGKTCHVSFAAFNSGTSGSVTGLGINLPNGLRPVGGDAPASYAVGFDGSTFLSSNALKVVATQSTFDLIVVLLDGTPFGASPGPIKFSITFELAE